MNIKSLKNRCFVNLELKNDWLTDWNGKCLSWVECWTDPGQIRMQKSFWTKAFLSVCCFYVFFGFQFLVFGDFGFHLSKCVSLLASFLFFLRFGCNHTRPSKLVKQVFSFCLPCLTHSLASHPCPQRVHLFSPADKKRGVRFLSATSPAKDHYLVSDSPPPFCSSLYPLHPPSLFASSPHPSVYIFGFRRFQRGGGERERWNQRWIRQRDGFGWKARL